MNTLLVVEDEKMIRRGICTMAKRSGVEIGEILEASNGEEALEIIKNCHVDLIFTDIRMPKMDGIELVKQLQIIENRPYIVAISGYDDFSYAVEMLRNGVKEYILKPVEREKITEVLIKIDEEIKEANAKEQTELQLGKQQLRYLIMNGPSSQEEIVTLKNKYDSIFYTEEYIVCCMSAKEIIEPSSYFIEIQEIGDHNVFILEEKELQHFQDEFILEHIAGISKPFKGIENLREAYMQAVFARRISFSLKKTYTYEQKISNVAQIMIDQAAELLEEKEMSHRLQLIGTGKTEELVKQWEKLFLAVEKRQIKVERFEATQERFIEEAMRTYRSSMGEDKITTLQEFRHLLSYSSIEEYKECFMEWILQLHEMINAKEETSVMEQKMKVALEYVQKNYNTDINMAVVSNLVSMNYSLFSFTFKQYTGENFVNYLKSLRVKRAKQLLEETDMKVIEIGQCVGYENDKHFLKLFKKYCGISPTEYRKNMQRARQ